MLQAHSGRRDAEATAFRDIVAPESGFGACASPGMSCHHLARMPGTFADRPTLPGGRGAGGPGGAAAVAVRPGAARCRSAEEIAQRRRAGLGLSRRLAGRNCFLLRRLRRRGGARPPAPCHPAWWRRPAFRPWPVRGRSRGAARRNHRRGRRAAPAARPSPACARRAHRRRRGASRGRRAIDRCRRRRPPAAGSVLRAAAARAGPARHWRRGSPVRSAARSARSARPAAASPRARHNARACARRPW